MNSSILFALIISIVQCFKFEKGHSFEPYDRPIFVEFEGITGDIYQETFSLLQNIDTLSISGSNVTDIEDGGLCSGDIRHLKIFENPMLPKFSQIWFGPNCESINKLTIVNNPDLVFDDGVFGSIKNLKVLEVKVQNISKIGTEFFDGANKIEILKMLFCNIDLIEEKSFDSLENLQELWLAQNRIKKIDGLLKNLKNLQKLDLTSNRLQQFPWEDLKNLNQLKELCLGRNKIIKFDTDKMAENLFKIELLELEFNPISCEERQRISMDLSNKIREDLEITFNIYDNGTCYTDY